jgi:hypothetical protein
MLNHKVSLFVYAPFLFMLAAPVGAKGPVVKLVVTGPDLSSPIEITDPDAIDVNIYGATFADREGSKIENVPASPVPPYQVRFYVAMDSDDDIQMKYVVYYVWDSAERRARIYFPGRHDAWWRHNVFTVALPFEGAWYHATESWGRAVQEAIFEHNSPRILAIN